MTVQQTLFAPGCALMGYKPELIDKMTDFLLKAGIISGTYLPCCKSDHPLHGPITLITCCPGCDHAFSTYHTDILTIPLWKVLLDTDFPFPDYQHTAMSIHDSCHSRSRNSSEMQAASRALCRKMNIDLIESPQTLDNVRCCGGCAKNLDERRAMAHRRAEGFPANDVVIYCTGCTRSLSITRVHPRHLLDLLYEEPTEGLTLKSHDYAAHSSKMNPKVPTSC